MTVLVAQLRLPSAPERWVLAGAALVWGGAGTGRLIGAPWLIGCFGAVALACALHRRRWVLVLGACLVGGALSGVLSIARQQAVLEAVTLEGPARVVGWAIDDVRTGPDGDWFLLRPTHLLQGGDWVTWDGPPLLVDLDRGVEVAARDRIQVDGTVRSQSGRLRGRPYSGRMSARRVLVLGPASDPLFWAGNAIRRRIVAGLAEAAPSPAGALLAGFLIGDVRRLPAVEVEQLRRAGLSHFVAVSGSNVAIFLVAWWVVTGPLAFGPRRRALGGLLGLVLFVVITRWEPSVLRAATMAGLVLTGRAAGLAVSPWTALGAAVGGLLLVSGELSGDVGFQLSVAATVGVMAGSGLFGKLRPRWLATSLAATLSAQVAVAPLLLAHFGSVPLVSPLANLLAAPLVLAATVSGGLGLLTGVAPLVGVGVAAARLVLEIAGLAAPWPQLGPAGMALVGVALLLGSLPRLRPMVAVGTATVVALTIAPVRQGPELPAVVFLDVGQGDAILLLGAEGETVLIDGGPDPVVLLGKLQHYRIGRIDLLAVTHPHSDHVAGLMAAVDRVPVRHIWHPGYPEQGGALAQLLEAAATRGIPVEVPEVGWRADLGGIDLEVLGPARRYASANDHSLVLLARVGIGAVLLPGDIEVIAQRELGPVTADVLKVPHQGAATSDLGWLAASAAPVAVISVGPNSFGHPSPEVIETLQSAGSAVLRTDLEGDIVLPLGGDIPGTAGAAPSGLNRSARSRGTPGAPARESGR